MSTNLVKTLPDTYSRSFFPTSSHSSPIASSPPPVLLLHPLPRFVVYAYEKEMSGLHQHYPARARPLLPVAAALSLSIYMDQRCSSSRMNCTGELDATLSGAAQAWTAERSATATGARQGPTHFTFRLLLLLQRLLLCRREQKEISDDNGNNNN